MGWKPKGNSCKIREISLVWEPRQKLGIIPKGEKDSPQRSLLPSFERHPNHWEFLPRSSPLDCPSLAHKPPYTSEGPHNMTVEPRNTSPLGRPKPEKSSKTNLRLSLPKTHHLLAMLSGAPNTTHSKEGRSPPMVGKIRSSIFSSSMIVANSSMVGHSSIPLK